MPRGVPARAYGRWYCPKCDWQSESFALLPSKLIPSEVAREITGHLETHEAQRVITAQELADRLGVLPQAVTRMCRQGRIFAVRNGRHWRIPVEDANRFIKEYTRTVGEPMVSIPKPRRYREPAGGRETVDVHAVLSKEAVNHIEAIRRQGPERLTRTSIIERAVLAYRPKE